MSDTNISLGTLRPEASEFVSYDQEQEKVHIEPPSEAGELSPQQPEPEGKPPNQIFGGKPSTSVEPKE